MSKRFRADLIQDGVTVASVDACSQQECEREIQHYALMYSQDGPVHIERKYNAHAEVGNEQRIKLG